MFGLDVHLQAIPARSPVPALLAHKQLLSTVLECLMQLQLRPGQEALGTGGTLRDRVGKAKVRSRAALESLPWETAQPAHSRPATPPP